MTYRVENGEAIFTDKSAVVDAIHEFLMVFGMNDELVGRMRASIAECVGLQGEIAISEIEMCIAGAFRTARSGEVACSGPCVSIASSAIGGAAAAYLVAR